MLNSWKTNFSVKNYSSPDSLLNFQRKNYYIPSKEQNLLTSLNLTNQANELLRLALYWCTTETISPKTNKLY